MGKRLFLWPSSTPTERLLCTSCHHRARYHRLRTVEGLLMVRCQACMSVTPCASRSLALADVEEG